MIKVEKPDVIELRKFGFIFAGIVVVLFGLLLPFLFGSSMPIWPWVIAAAFVLFALLSPAHLWFVYKPWMIFGHYMGLINSKIIICILFFILITPIAIVLKVLGKDFMGRRPLEEGDSYWKKADSRSTQHMKNIY